MSRTTEHLRDRASDRERLPMVLGGPNEYAPDQPVTYSFDSATGEHVFTLGSSLLFAPIRVPAGTHEVRVKVASTNAAVVGLNCINCDPYLSGQPSYWELVADTDVAAISNSRQTQSVYAYSGGTDFMVETQLQPVFVPLALASLTALECTAFAVNSAWQSCLVMAVCRLFQIPLRYSGAGTSGLCLYGRSYLADPFVYAVDPAGVSPVPATGTLAMPASTVKMAGVWYSQTRGQAVLGFSDVTPSGYTGFFPLAYISTDANYRVYSFVAAGAMVIPQHWGSEAAGYYMGLKTR